MDPGLVSPVSPTNVYRIIASLSDEIITVADCVTKEIRDKLCGEVSVHTLNTGISLPSQIPSVSKLRSQLLEDGRFESLICFVGLLSKRKGILDLIEAMEIVAKAYQRCRLIVLGGDGGVQKLVRRSIRNKKLTEQVSLLGTKRDAINYIAASDFLIMPSHSDPLPVAVLEAMAMRKPVIATDSGGCSDMVIDKENGYLVPPQAPPLLAKAICSLLSSNDLIDSMGHASYYRVQKFFDSRLHARNFEKILSNIAVPAPKTFQHRETTCGCLTWAATEMSANPVQRCYDRVLLRLRKIKISLLR